MGLKDNFSQAVKELWKKDGQDGDVQQGAGGEPSELDKYLREQNSADNSPSAQAPVQNGDVNSNGVPLETPYYPESAPTEYAKSTQNNAQSAPAQDMGDFNRNAMNAQNSANAANSQANQPSDSAYNQNVRNVSQNFGQNARNDGYNQGYNQNGYNQNGYNQGGYNQNMGGMNGRFVPPPSGNGAAPSPMGNEVEETTVISKNTQIEGNIRSLANMTIDGNIKGNLETTRNVDMTGKIVGDITANNASLNSAAMQGNISLKGRMKMDRDTILIGDLSSQYADINGRIRGKLDIVGKAELKRDAIVFGDINASTIAVTDGAIIQGYVNTTFLSKDDSRNVFPDAISIEEQKQGMKSAQNNGGETANTPV